MADITLSFATDGAEEASGAFENVGDAATNMGSEVEESSGAFDSVGEAADGLRSPVRGLASTFRGLNSTGRGFGQIAEGDIMGGLSSIAMGAAGLVRGLTSFLIPALSSTVTWLKSTRLATLAQAAASGVARAATAVWTGIQAAFNFVMALNPVVLIIIAIVALIAIIVIAYKRSETFRNIVQGAFRAIGAAVRWLGDRFSEWWSMVKGLFGKAVEVFRGIPGKLRSAFSGLVDIITWPFRTAFNFVADAWNNTIGRLSWTVPSWVPFVGGNSISAPQLPKFHSGGRVPGAPGTEMLAILQAGETVTPAGQSGGGFTIAVERGGSSTSIEQMIAALFLYLIRSGAIRLTVRNGRVAVA
jgi:phage-related protein